QTNWRLPNFSDRANAPGHISAIALALIKSSPGLAEISSQSIRRSNMSKFLLTVCAFGLLLSSAFAQEWTKEDWAAGLKTTEFTRHIPAGKQRTLDNFGYLNPDCTPIEDTDTEITKEPEHGSAVIETIERFPAYAKDNVRSKCNEKRMRMPV